jgi:hypothetical protein
VIVHIFLLKSSNKKNQIKNYIFNLLFSRGCLWSCGLNNYHQLGHPGVIKFLIPTKVE